ncbi:cysteine--tRNA ligase [Salibaculum halophilum]|uniref:cysteine--tRNA ligase n=1 Tax=Salibaculum halophilum TaxID=1914408 RepID=UPI000A0F5F1C|nr:cysteine--tRNA ligase [Salibaculum halophilum]
MVTIELYNTRTKAKAPFVPLDPQNVRMYVCGPTVYDRAHLGNARPAIVFDVLYRLLRHEYGADHVTYVRNFTDVDDKINARAAETGRDISDITAETSQWYLDDMAEIGVLEPNRMPRATAYIAQMVAMIEDLVARGHAYAAEGHVLFSVDSWKEAYGRLSGRSVDDMIAGARVEVAPYKRNPMDFVLWKPSQAGEPGWDSPWGLGRPGWHIECSAMAKALLGEVFDIHGGGNDLMFPHHENEIAQSCCANGTEEMARVWMHNEMLQVEGRKMSKSLGNFFTVRDLLDQGVPGEVIRFVMLSTHYRKPMDWTKSKANAALKELQEWYQLVDGVEPLSPYPEVVKALSDDLHTYNALFSLRGLYKRVLLFDSKLIDHMEEFDSLEEAKGVFLASAHLLGLLERRTGMLTLLPIIHSEKLKILESKLNVVRVISLQERDFFDFDKKKADLLDAGVEVRVTKDGVKLVPGPNFDPAKLEGLE